jgi:hypothetical protein
MDITAGFQEVKGLCERELPQSLEMITEHGHRNGEWHILTRTSKAR